MKKYMVFFISVMILTALTACGPAAGVSPSQTQPELSEPAWNPASSAANEGLDETGTQAGPLLSEDISAAEGRTLVAHFSNTGNTEGIAKIICEYTGGELFEIRAAVPYTEEDLDYSNHDSRSSQEQNDETARPEIAANLENAGDYDVIFLGYPIWWGQAPKILYTFIELNDFTGAAIIPFCTSGSSGIGTSGVNLRQAGSAGSQWLEGRRFASGAAEDEIQAWIDGLGFDFK